MPAPDRPTRPKSNFNSSRLRHRWKRKLAVWVLAARAVDTLNALGTGKVDRLTCRRRMKDVPEQVRAAWGQAQTWILSESARLNTARRGLVLTGVDATAVLSTRTSADSYQRVARTRVAQEPLIAESIDEPASNNFVDMLEGLGPVESEFYRTEANLVDWSGKSLTQFREIQDHFGFVGGTHQQYLAYFHRRDLPRQMWTFRRLWK